MVCCGSAFPQLFTSSKRSPQKPKFSPSETYLRMMSRLQSSRRRQQTVDDTTWFDGTAGSQNSTIGFDSYLRTVDEEDGHRRDADPEAGYGGMGCQMEDTKGSSIMVSQPSLPMPAAYTYIHTSQQDREEIPENQIYQRFEFGVK